MAKRKVISKLGRTITSLRFEYIYIEIFYKLDFNAAMDCFQVFIFNFYSSLLKILNQQREEFFTKGTI